MTAHNVAKSYNMLNAQEPDGTIDYSKACMSHGNMIGVEGVKVEVVANGLHFSWTDNTGADHERGNDQVMLLAYNLKASYAEAEMGGAKRKKCDETLVMTDIDAGDSYHTWISFISNDRLQISMSTYCGVYTF